MISWFARAASELKDENKLVHRWIETWLTRRLEAARKDGASGKIVKGGRNTGDHETVVLFFMVREWAKTPKIGNHTFVHQVSVHV